MKAESIETTLAAEELKKLQPGDVCAYAVLEAVIGCDPQGKGYQYVASARRKVEKELDCVLDVERGVGIKRLMPREVVNRGGKDIAHIRRSSRRGLRRQTTLVPVESESMSNEERIKFHGNLSMLGILHHMTKPTTRKSVEAASHAANRVLNTGDILQLFGK